jgi:type VII secretion EsaA-like protein
MTTGIVLCALIGTFFVVHHEIDEDVVTTKPTIALVNEDRDGAFNETTYNFGKVFVNRVSHDNKYNWQVISRPVADRAYDEGSVQAVIYLPQNFTQNILTLQAINPQKAQVDYKVLTSQSELNNQMLQNKIVDVLYDFNTSIVKMYYGSVAANVADAQTNMNHVVASQDTILSDLTSDVYEPFQTTDQFYSAVVSVSNGLKLQNEAWIQAQNMFTTAVVNMLTTASEHFADKMPLLTEYFTTQKNIVDMNVVNANASIAEQASADQQHYHNQYTNAYERFLAHLRQLRSQDELGNETGIYPAMEQTMAAYETVIGGMRDNLGAQSSALRERQAELFILEQQLYKQFFDQDVSPSIDQHDFTHVETDEHAKAAMAKLVAKSFKKRKNLADSSYEKKIAHFVSSVSVDQGDYESLLNTLVRNGSMTPEQKKALFVDLAVLKNYASEFEITPANVNFSEAPTNNTTDQLFAKQLTIVVPAGQKYVLTLEPEDETKQVKISPIFVIDDHGGNWLTQDSLQVTLDNTTPDDKDEYEIFDGRAEETGHLEGVTEQMNEQGRTSQLRDKTYVITYQVSLGQTEKAIVRAQWGEEANTDTQFESVDIFGLIPRNTISEYAGGKQFSYITELIYKIKTASQLITFLYGAPDATPADMVHVKRFAERAHAKSIYELYGNMDERPIAEQISMEDIAAYRMWGSTNIARVRETLNTLQTTITRLEADKDSLTGQLPVAYFKQTTDELNNWHTMAMAAVHEQYATWTSNEANLLEQKQWTDYVEGERALYYDQTGGETLYETISQLVVTSEQQATDTANSSQIIEDNTETFTVMVDTVTKTQDEAKGVIENTASLLSSGADAFEKSQDYAENFSSVLANTRTAGVDSNNVFSFFAHPLAAQNMTKKVEKILPSFDWQPVLIFGIGLFAGMFALRLGSTMKRIIKK